jgi:hypothetical protein
MTSCNHQHDSDHDHHNCHQHDHAHQHDSDYDHRSASVHDDQSGSFSLTQHEGALIASLLFNEEGNTKAIEAKLESDLAALAAWIAEQGGVVGHIKATVSATTSVSSFSTTGGSVTVLHSDSRDHHIKVVAIVFEVDKDALQQKMLALR